MLQWNAMNKWNICRLFAIILLLANKNVYFIVWLWKEQIGLYADCHICDTLNYSVEN